MKKVLLILLFAFTSVAGAGDLFRKGSQELGIWTGGGSGFKGRTRDTQLWLTGGRYGRWLTNSHSGFFRGSLAYNVEVIPAFIVFQTTNTVYSAGVTPFLLRWDLLEGRKVIPYIDFGVGFVFSSSDVPVNTTRLNFTPQAAGGIYVVHRPNQAVRLTVRFMHISNAGLGKHNPGINSLQLQFGYQWFK